MKWYNQGCAGAGLHQFHWTSIEEFIPDEKAPWDQSWANHIIQSKHNACGGNPGSFFHSGKLHENWYSINF